MSGLEGQGFDREESQAALSWLKSRGLLNDERTAERHAEKALLHRRMGLAAAEAELEALGVSPEVKERALETWRTATEADRAKELLQAKLKPGDGPAKAARLLAGKGYDEDTIREALSERFPELELP
jgi:SOS response regulatory protein OraA/RecX